MASQKGAVGRLRTVKKLLQQPPEESGILMIPDTFCKRTWDSTASLHRTETFSDRHDQEREIPPPWRQDQILLQGSPQFTDHEHAAWTRPPRCPKQSSRQAGFPQTTQALTLGELSFGYIHTLPWNTIPVSHREARQHLAAPCRKETAQLLHLELTQSDAQTGAQKGSICPISYK